MTCDGPAVAAGDVYAEVQSGWPVNGVDLAAKEAKVHESFISARLELGAALAKFTFSSALLSVLDGGFRLEIKYAGTVAKQ